VARYGLVWQGFKKKGGFMKQFLTVITAVTVILIVAAAQGAVIDQVVPAEINTNLLVVKDMNTFTLVVHYVDRDDRAGLSRLLRDGLVRAATKGTPVKAFVRNGEPCVIDDMCPIAFDDGTMWFCPVEALNILKGA
jgi:hypothetical protein